jgi:hypothetical protein
MVAPAATITSLFKILVEWRLIFLGYRICLIYEAAMLVFMD